MAPPTKPIERKRATGNPGKRPLPDTLNQLSATTEIPRAPTGMGSRGRACWAALWGYQTSMPRPWITPGEAGLVERYCRAQDELHLYRQTLKQDGHFTSGSQGQMVLHPAVKALRDLEAAVTKMESLLGLTPSDRARLGLAEITAASKMDALLARQADRTRSKGE